MDAATLAIAAPADTGSGAKHAGRAAIWSAVALLALSAVAVAAVCLLAPPSSGPPLGMGCAHIHATIA